MRPCDCATSFAARCLLAAASWTKNRRSLNVFLVTPARAPRRGGRQGAGRRAHPSLHPAAESGGGPRAERRCMVDIVLAFAKDAEEAATALAWAAAERGYAVWGDPELMSDLSDREIAAAFAAPRTPVVIWSDALAAEAAARPSAYGELSRDRSVSLQITASTPPFGTVVDFRGWRKEAGVVTQAAAAAAAVAGPAESGAGGADPVARFRIGEDDAAAWALLRTLSGADAYDAYLKRFGPRALFAAEASRRLEKAAPPAVAPVRAVGGGSAFRSLALFAGGALLGGMGLVATSTALGGDPRAAFPSERSVEATQQNALEQIDDLSARVAALQDALSEAERARDGFAEDAAASQEALILMRTEQQEAAAAAATAAAESARRARTEAEALANAAEAEAAEARDAQAALRIELGAQTDALARARSEIADLKSALSAADGLEESPRSSPTSTPPQAIEAPLVTTRQAPDSPASNAPALNASASDAAETSSDVASDRSEAAAADAEAPDQAPAPRLRP